MPINKAILLLILGLFSSPASGQASSLKLYGPCPPTKESCQTFTKDGEQSFEASTLDQIDLTIKEAHMTKSGDGFNVMLADESAKLFEAFTASHINQTIALVLEDKLLSAPHVMEPIAGGEFLISGWGTENLNLCRQLFAGCQSIVGASWLENLVESIKDFW